MHGSAAKERSCIVFGVPAPAGGPVSCNHPFQLVNNQFSYELACHGAEPGSLYLSVCVPVRGVRSVSENIVKHIQNKTSAQ